jgi:hypothetical protein
MLEICSMAATRRVFNQRNSPLKWKRRDQQRRLLQLCQLTYSGSSSACVANSMPEICSRAGLNASLIVTASGISIKADHFWKDTVIGIAFAYGFAARRHSNSIANIFQKQL